MKNIIVVVIILLTLTACVSNNTVQTAKVGDFDLNCHQLKNELTQLGAEFE